ncbi:hypothetical protein POTOM_059690 [Populus tomentosa]|uniref:Methyltransferase type 11 domain-containing protein n=1 Tax=Populus tomentosa TaxID=118781 RepID=A0A8X7XT99_POPTO|nr:hypothetical protein POTOM_059690 [Populus tomentosa]
MDPTKKRLKLWSSKSWLSQVSSFTTFFQSLNLLNNETKVLCVSAGAGHEVMALNNMGVSDVTGVEIVDSLPLVKRADPNNLPFFDGVFDLAFSAHLEEALFPLRFAGEMERTVRNGGVCVVVVEECGGVEVDAIVGLFRKSMFVGAENVTLIGMRMTRIIMRWLYCFLYQSMKGFKRHNRNANTVLVHVISPLMISNMFGVKLNCSAALANGNSIFTILTSPSTKALTPFKPLIEQSFSLAVNQPFISENEDLLVKLSARYNEVFISQFNTLVLIQLRKTAQRYLLHPGDGATMELFYLDCASNAWMNRRLINRSNEANNNLDALGNLALLKACGIP